MASVRSWHSYLSVFVAPSILFFALTGALQIFNLHEAHDGYQPPALIEKLSAVHKDQVFERRGPPPGSHATAPAEPHGGPLRRAHGERRSTSASTLLLKWFFLAVALVLAATATLGVWIGITHATRRRLSWLLLAGGALIPVMLVLV